MQEVGKVSAPGPLTKCIKIKQTRTMNRVEKLFLIVRFIDIYLRKMRLSRDT